MSEELKPLADIWLELQLVTMSAELSGDDHDRLEALLDGLKQHVNHNQEEERKILLRWFTARLGSKLFDNHYRQLLLELANLMSSIWLGSPKFHSADEVFHWLQELPPSETVTRLDTEHKKQVSGL